MVMRPGGSHPQTSAGTRPDCRALSTPGQMYAAMPDGLTFKALRKAVNRCLVDCAWCLVRVPPPHLHLFISSLLATYCHLADDWLPSIQHISCIYDTISAFEIYTSHPTRSECPDRLSDYHMTLLRSLYSPDSFPHAGAYRNARDWAKEQRDKFIKAANGKAETMSTRDI